MDNDAAILVTGADDDRKEFMQQWLDSNESTSVDFAGTGTGECGIDREEGFVSRFYSTCLREFQRLCRQEQKGYAHGSRFYLLKEELDKLYMWGEGFGPGELDKALDESEELRDNILDLLVNLGELLICELQASSTVARHGQIHELESFIKQAKLIMSDVDGQVDLDALASDATCLDRDEYSDDNVHDFCKDVVFVIKCLMELGPSLEQNLVSAGRSVHSVSKSAFVLFCLSGPAGFYVSLVRDKFKKASRELVERLGEANWQRHLKVRNMFGDTENDQANARSVFQPAKTFRDSGIGTSVPAGTQYAPSDTSFRTSNTEGALRSLRVPPTPIKATNGRSFRCKYCGNMVSTVRTRTQWKMHVFGDLMPYICTFDGCPHKLRCFPSRSAWAHHEFEEHRFDRYWACPECPRKSCSTLDWEHHLNNAHNQKFAGHNLVSARNNACRISAKRAEDEQCPLCLVVLGKPRRAFVKHVCRHMEDIALMALPSNAEEDSEIGSISTNHTSNEGNKTSKDLHTNEEYTIKCICGFKTDDGNTVYCERCDSWQHTECYYLDEGGVVPTKDVLSSIDHFCADCKPRPLDARAAIKRQLNRRAYIGSNALWMQPNEQQSNAPPEKQTARIMSPYDTTDGLIGESAQMRKRSYDGEPNRRQDYDHQANSVYPMSAPMNGPPPSPGRQRIHEMENGHARDRPSFSPRQTYPPPPGSYPPPPQETYAAPPRMSDSLVRNEYDPHVERALVNVQPSLSPDHFPPLERSPTPERMSRLPTSKRRTRRPKAQASQGDAVLIGFMGGLKHRDLALKAGEEPLDQESEESTDEDDEETTNRESGKTIQLARNAVSIVERCDERRDDQHGTSNHEQPESGSDSTDLLRTTVPNLESGKSPKEDQYGPYSNEAMISYSEGLSFVNPCGKQAGVSDRDVQTLGSQEAVYGRRRPKRRFSLAEMAAIAFKRKTGACNDCRRAIKKCTHDPPKDSMSNVEPTKPLPSLASSTVSVDNPLSRMTESTSGPFDDSASGFFGDVSGENINEHDDEPLNIHPYQALSRKSHMISINEHPNHQPPVPQFQPVDTEPPSKI